MLELAKHAPAVQAWRLPRRNREVECARYFPLLSDERKSSRHQDSRGDVRLTPLWMHFHNRAEPISGRPFFCAWSSPFVFLPDSAPSAWLGRTNRDTPG